MYTSLLFVCVFISVAFTQKDPNFADGRSTIVHLFEWKWKDIADECERFLAPKGFGGVQISPPNENLVLNDYNRPWWERYQPVSYIINTRSGDEAAFVDMTKRCNAVGVRIYVDAVVNHMTGFNGVGTAGSIADRDNKNFPAVPYTSENFHSSCALSNWQDVNNVRLCELNALADLDQSTNYVRGKIIDFMNHLIDLGVAGFRIDAAKLMSPDDLRVIFSSLNNLNPDYGFSADARPYIYQEVVDYGNEPITRDEYKGIGAITEFRYGSFLSNILLGGDNLATLVNWGPEWSLIDSSDALAFIDNHDTQRSGGGDILTFQNSKLYKMAVAFMEAHPYGVTRIMSSYYFDNNDQSPPQDNSGNIISPSINDDNTCGNGWVCEHRWREIFRMVEFRNTVSGTEITNWWSDGVNQIAFSRGNKGFVAFTNEGNLNQNLNTGLPAGSYCDIISADIEDGVCTGRTIVVGDNGYADIFLGADDFDGVLAIHVNAKL